MSKHRSPLHTRPDKLIIDTSVVTVHGIRDDYKTAWITKKGIWWVKEQLFKGLSTRQIDYAYDVNEDSELYDPDGIRLHAQRLVAEYADIRDKLEDVCTSMIKHSTCY